MKHALNVVVAAFALFLVAPLLAYADSPAVPSAPDSSQANYEAAPLKNLPPVLVKVDVGDAVSKAGISQADLQDHVELRLREAGIQLDSKPVSVPFLEVEIDGMQVGYTRILSYQISVQLSDEVALSRDPSITLCTDIWSDVIGGYCGSLATDSIQEGVDKALDKFCNDYLTANPKTSSSSTGSSTDSSNSTGSTDSSGSTNSSSGSGSSGLSRPFP